MRMFMVIVMLVASWTAWAQEQSVAAPRLLKAEDLPIAVEPDALQRQYQALSGMSLERLEYSTRGPVDRINGATGLVLPASARVLKEGDDASNILPVVQDVLLANRNESLNVHSNILIGSTRALKLSQSIRGIPVINGGVWFSCDEATLHVSVLTANFVPDRGLPRAPKLSAQQAEQKVPEALKFAVDLRQLEIEILDGTYLAYYASPGQSDPPQLVWVVRAELGTSYELFYVNALTGAIAGRKQESFNVTRRVYNANNTTPSIPNGLPTEMSPSAIAADTIAKEAYDYIEDADLKLRPRFPYLTPWFWPSTANIVVRFKHLPSPNASYRQVSGNDYFLFDGPSTTYYSFTKPRDIPAHEYAHAIGYASTSTENYTPSDDQAGALHES